MRESEGLIVIGSDWRSPIEGLEVLTGLVPGSRRDHVVSVERGSRAIADDLRRRWNAEDASVLGDWCEERGLLKLAERLRTKMSSKVSHHERRTKALIEYLCEMMGLKPKNRIGVEDWLNASGEGVHIATQVQAEVHVLANGVPKQISFGSVTLAGGERKTLTFIAPQIMLINWFRADGIGTVFDGQLIRMVSARSPSAPDGFWRESHPVNHHFNPNSRYVVRLGETLALEVENVSSDSISFVVRARVLVIEEPVEA